MVTGKGDRQDQEFFYRSPNFPHHLVAIGRFLRKCAPFPPDDTGGGIYERQYAPSLPPCFPKIFFLIYFFSNFW